MATEAGRLGFVGVGMRIVTSHAGKRAARSPAAGARGELFHVAGDLQILPSALPDKVGRVVGQTLAGLEFGEPAARPFDAGLTAEMALAANGFAAFRIKARRMDHVSFCGVAHVFTAGAVATLATDAVFEKWWVAIAVLGADDRPDLAGMAQQTTGLDGTIQPDVRLALVTRRRIPDFLL